MDARESGLPRLGDAKGGDTGAACPSVITTLKATTVHLSNVAPAVTSPQGMQSPLTMSR